MCGILGLICRSAQIDVERLEGARDTLAHRGPDAAGIWLRGSENCWNVALAHRRLSILDLSNRGAQPLVLDEQGRIDPAPRSGQAPGRLVLVFNGEIYNYVELRDELRSLGHTIRSTGDGEVLLCAYAQWGPDCVDRLNGMFAFAVWNEARRELFCARDRFGEKPFHYIVAPERGLFAFASEAKALVAAGVVSGDLDGQAVYRYFRFGESAGAEQTIWRGVRRLLPAHTISVRFEGDRLTVARRRYWDLEARTERDMSLEAAVDHFRELFSDSVRLRLRSDVPVGTSLSGGLDSSSVLCQVRALGAAGGQRAFSARMTDPALDEGTYISEVLQSTGVPGYEVVPTAESLLADLDALCFHQEDPLPSTSVFASFLVQRLAREHEVIVLLDGQGADEYLAGYTQYGALVLVDLARRGRLLQWWNERQAYRARCGADPVPVRAAMMQLLHPARSEGASLTVDGLRPTTCLRPDVAAAFAAERPRTMAWRGDALKTRLYADLMGGHLQELLRYADRNSMAFSREVRLPFLDHRLVEFAMSLPREYLWSGGESKRVLRSAMRGIVPDAILDRRDKIGFAAPDKSWWQGPCGGALRERLAAAELALEDVIEPGAAAAGSADALSIITIASARDQMRKLAATPVADTFAA